MKSPFWLKERQMFAMCTHYSRNSEVNCAFLLPKTLGVLEDLKDMRATVCLWSSLGKGVISLFDLEQE